MPRDPTTIRWRPPASATPTEASAPGAVIAHLRTWLLAREPVEDQVAKCSQLFVTR
jgi:hypothetical protein